MQWLGPFRTTTSGGSSLEHGCEGRVAQVTETETESTEEYRFREQAWPIESDPSARKSEQQREEIAAGGKQGQSTASSTTDRAAVGSSTSSGGTASTPPTTPGSQPGTSMQTFSAPSITLVGRGTTSPQGAVAREVEVAGNVHAATFTFDDLRACGRSRRNWRMNPSRRSSLGVATQAESSNAVWVPLEFNERDRGSYAEPVSTALSPVA